MDLSISMEVDAVVANLKRKARMISTSEEITQVGTIFENGEREIGELIAKAMEKVGKRVSSLFKCSFCSLRISPLHHKFLLPLPYSSLVVSTACLFTFHYKRKKNKKCELDEPIVLIHEKKISNINSVIKVLRVGTEGSII